MANIKIDFTKTVGEIKPLHGVGQPPMAGRNFSRFHYLTEAGVPFSRLHDVGGMFGGFRWVDVPNIFRDFDADENDPASYDFAFTDLLITALMEAKVEPYFRLGVTIENDARLKAYRIYPPKDYGKWARICEHIIRHYTEGWADGFEYKITYWEIWNEPDSFPDLIDNMMWLGSPESYYEFYDIAAKHLKACFPNIKIGGYAACGFYGIYEEKLDTPEKQKRFPYLIKYFKDFIAYIKKTGAPLDFFSWHIYDSSPKRFEGYANFVRETLDEAGYTETESSCNEWNCDSGTCGTYHHAAKTAAALLALQKAGVDNSMFYDARYGLGRYSGIFNAYEERPHPAYYALTAFNRLYELKNEVETECDDERVYATAASDGKRGCVVITNDTEEAVPLSVEANMDAVITLITCDGMKIINGESPKYDPKCDGAIPMPDAIPAESIITILYR